MKILVTGSSGHLGEAMVRVLRASGHATVGVDLLPSPFTDSVGSIADRTFVARCCRGVDAIVHTATLHKPHVVTHSCQQFVDTNVTGTLNLLEEAVEASVDAFVFTSTTSVFGRALTAEPKGGVPWLTEETVPLPKNIYGVTKLSAENLCELFHRRHRLPCLILRTSRFFPEEDDSPELRAAYGDANLKANEFLNRRVELQDAADAHVLALQKAPSIGFGRYIISATTPFRLEDCLELGQSVPNVVARYIPQCEPEYERRGWRMFPTLDRIYVNSLARTDLGWCPKYDFAFVVEQLGRGEDPRSELARQVGSKRYHAEEFDHGPYPVE